MHFYSKIKRIMAFIVKNTTFPGLLDLVSPHSCRGCGRLGEAFCECCKNNIISARKNVCPVCKEEKEGGVCKNCPELPEIFVVDKRSGMVGKLIREYKYQSVRALARLLAELLAASLPEDFENVVLVPLPTATQHIRARGLDHMMLIAKNLARIRKFKVEKVLIRAKNTVQVGADAEKRQKQAKEAYAVNPKVKIDPGKTYILLDDVWTTGASALAAYEKMKKAGAKKVVIAVLAYSG